MIIKDDQCPNGCGQASEIRAGIGRLKITGYRCNKCGYKWQPWKPYPIDDSWAGTEISGTSHAAGYHD